MIDSNADGEVVAPNPAVIEQNTSGVVGVLAEALAQHAYDITEVHQRMCVCGEKVDDMSQHLASVVAALANIAVIEVPTDITPEPEDNTWFRVRGFDYYGGTDEDMPIDQIEAQAADILAIARYRRAAAGGNVNG